MGDKKSVTKEAIGTVFETGDDNLGNTSEWGPADSSFLREELAEHNRKAFFRIGGLKIKGPGISANDRKLAESPDQKLRLIQDLIGNFKRQRLR